MFEDGQDCIVFEPSASSRLMDSISTGCDWCRYRTMGAIGMWG
jgi:hypothetical protein